MVGTWSKAALLVVVCGLFACSSSSSENDRELPRDYSQDATTQGTASDSGANADAESSDTGAMTILDSGSTSPIDSGNASSVDSGNTDILDSGATNVEDAGFAMDAQSQSPADSGILADAMAMNASCPPRGPFGSGTGDTTPNIELQDCDGNTVRLHDFCNRKATWLFSLPLW